LAWPEVRRAAAAFEAPVAAFRPAYLEEMRGIADGAGLDVADVLAINVRTEVMYAAKARQAPLAARGGELPAECSAFAVAPAPRAGGQQAATLLGQNWDWLLHSAQTLVVLEVSQDDGPDFVTVVEAGLLAKVGLNAAGLGLVTNALVTNADIGAPGLPYHVLLRAILDCPTVTEALMVLQAGMRSSSANYLIAHASGVTLGVEAAPGDFTRLCRRACRRPKTCRCGPCRAARSACSASAPAHQIWRPLTTSVRCSPIMPTTRTASAPTPIRTTIHSSRAPPSRPSSWTSAPADCGSRPAIPARSRTPN
jgi:hypothetical protein